MTWLEVLRLAVWMAGGLVLGFTFVVAWRHLQAWRRSSEKRLLPLHVWCIALSYDGLLVSLLSRTGPVDWRGSIYIPAILLGLVAMLAMHRLQSETREGDHEGS
jgi:hypothetical protein